VGAHCIGWTGGKAGSTAWPHHAAPVRPCPLPFKLSIPTAIRWRELGLPALLCIAVFLGAYELFLARALIAPLVRGLGTTVGTIQASIVLFSVATAMSVPTMSKLGAMHGLRWLFRLGLILLVVGSAVAALSPNVLGIFVGFSILGGIGAAPLIAVAWSVMQRRYQGRQRDIGFAALGLAIGLAGAISPAVTGLIAEHVGWRWVFLPPSLVAMGAFSLIHVLSDERSETAESIDWLATSLSMISVFAVLCGLCLTSEYGWWASRKEFFVFGIWRQPIPISVAPVLLITGAIMLGLSGVERRSHRARTRRLAFRAGLFKDRRFVAGSLTGALHGAAVAGLFFSLFVYVPFAFKLDSVATSVAVLPLNVGMVAAVAAVGLLYGRIVPKYAVQFGLIVCGTGTALLTRSISPDGSLSDIYPGLIVAGLGSGLVLGQIADLVLANTPPDASVESSGIYNSFQDLGGSLGTAILGAILMLLTSMSIVGLASTLKGIDVGREGDRVLVTQLSDRLQTLTKDEKQEIVESLPPETRDLLESTVKRAGAEAMRTTLVAIDVTLGLSLLASCFMPTSRPSLSRPADHAPQGLEPT
jgi:MFS family permease